VTSTLDHVASAALPVAIGLLVLAAASRMIRWTGFGDAQAQQTARRYLEPLSVWCLVALAVRVLARGAAGGSWIGRFVVAVALGAVALGLWLAGDRTRAPGSAEDAGTPVEQTPPRAGTPARVETPDRAAAERPPWEADTADGVAPGRLWSRG
jgi:hypothetical protein